METDKRKKYKKLFLLFFTAMLLLHILSRVLDSLIVPKVQIQTFTSGSLNYLIEGEGVVKAAENRYVEIPGGIRVDRVLSVGEKVEEGQGVVFLRVSDLEKKKKEKERELKKLLLTLEKEKLSARLPEGTTEQEALAGELAQGEKSVYDAFDGLQKEQERYVKKTEELKKKRDQDKRFAKQRRNLARQEIERSNHGVDKEERRSYAQAELDYETELEQIDREYDKAMEELEGELQDAASKLEDMQEEYGRLLGRAQLAAKEDAAVREKRETEMQISKKTQEILLLDIGARQEEVDRLERWIESEGEIKSGTAGFITRMDTVPGSVTSGEEIAEIGCGDFLFSGTLSREEAAILEEGDSVEISIPAEVKKVRAVISGISASAGEKGENDAAVFTALMEKGDYRVGSTAQYTVNKSPALQYQYLIPVEALREDGQGKFCLVAEKDRTILGEVEIAVRVSLELLKTDGRRAAVSGGLTAGDRIITGSSKSIREGDRVRIQS